MSNLVLANAIEAALMRGDLSQLSPEQKLSYYKNVCETVGLNPLTKPFEYLKLNGKEVLYTTKGCAEQLRSIHKISIKVVDKQKIDDVYIVTAEANSVDRCDSSTGAVSIAGLKGEQLANAMMKAETKAKRRVTLSICGLNMLDELEVETIKEPAASQPQRVQVQSPSAQLIPFDIDAENAEFAPSEYVVQFGKWKGQKLSELDVYQLDNYVKHIKKSAAEKGETIRAGTQEFLIAAENFMISREFVRT